MKLMILLGFYVDLKEKINEKKSSIRSQHSSLSSFLTTYVYLVSTVLVNIYTSCILFTRLLTKSTIPEPSRTSIKI